MTDKQTVSEIRSHGAPAKGGRRITLDRANLGQKPVSKRLRFAILQNGFLNRTWASCLQVLLLSVSVVQNQDTFPIARQVFCLCGGSADGNGRDTLYRSMI